MKISVITSSYNQRGQLYNAYLSLLLQKEYVHEWIICDDGSTDGSWDYILDLAKTAPFTVQAFAQNNKGMRLARNLNSGIRHATGDLLIFVMGDSYLQADTLKKLHESYLEGSAGCGVRVNVDDEGNELSLDWRLKEDIEKPVTNVIWSQLTGNSMIVKRIDLEKIGLWDEGYEGYGMDDYSVFYRLEKAGIPLVLYGNVRINHLYHGEGQPDNPKSIERFKKERAGLL